MVRTNSSGREVHDSWARGLLEDNDWNVEDAFANWQRRRDEMPTLLAAQTLTTMSGVTQPLQETDDSLPVSLGHQEIYYGDIPEQERRGLITTFRDLIEERHNVDLTRAEAALWMVLHGMDPEIAFQEYTDLATMRQELHEQFDSLRLAANSHEARSEALATLVTMTDRADWYSLQQCLERFDWNLSEAVEEWHANGIAPVKHADDRPGSKFKLGFGRRKVYGKISRPMPTPQETRVGREAGRHWPPMLKSFCEDPADIQTPTDITTIIDQNGNRPPADTIRGALIRENRNTAKWFCPDPSKLFVEVIKNDKYFCNDFTNKNFKFPGRDADIPGDPRVMFDWKNMAHLEKLNNWSRQYCERALGHKSPRRASSQRFSPEELQMLVDFYEETLQSRLSDASAGTLPDSLLPFGDSGQGMGSLCEAFERAV